LGVDVSLGQHAAAEQDGNRVGVDFVRLGLAAVDGLHVQSVAKDEGALFLLTEIGEPVPGEHALASDGQSVAEGGDGVEEGVGAGSDGLLADDGSGGVKDTEGEGSGVEIDAAVESVRLVVESHHGLRGMG
jgi:hypothetical protein